MADLTSVGGLFAPLAAGAFWALSAGLLGLLVVALAAALAWFVSRAQQAKLRMERFVEAVCQLQPEDMMRPDVLDRIPPMPADGCWGRIGVKVCETLEGHGRWVADQRSARMAVEIRASRLADELAQVREILGRLSDPILVVDGYGQIVFANPSAEQLFGFEAANAENRAAASLVRCEKLVQLLTATSQRRAAGSRCDELEVTDPQGQSRSFRVTALKLAGHERPDVSGRPGGAVAVLQDIAEQKAAQKRNAEFVSAVSHEMKTPLAGIKAYVELLADGDVEDDATREEFLGVIDGQADRLQRLVENMLNLARIEAGVVKVSKQPRSLNDLLEEAARVVQPSAEAKQITLTTELSSMYLAVLADRDMLLQVAINLLSNAIKYTHPGGRVTIRSRLADDQIRFEVSDTGVGLNPEDCQRVFEKFYRVSKDKNMASGTGLGLPLAKHIVEDVHGGQLTVESKPGEGSTFIVTLPSAGQMSA